MLSPPVFRILIMGAALPVSMALSAGMGYLPIPFGEVLEVVWSRISGTLHPDALASTVIWEVRLPRILAAAAVGAGLSLSGAVFQGILKNPLADPYTLGVSTGAAFGACLAMTLNMGALHAFSVGAFAFGGAVATLLLVLYLSDSAGGASSNDLILSGIIVAAILSAGISFIKYAAGEKVAVILFWLMGSFASRTWQDAALALACVLAGSAVCMFFGKDLNLLALGDRTASSLGVDVKRTRILLLVAGSLVAAACVSLSGIIGFVGLLTPHMMRWVTGADNRALMPASMAAGALLLLWADTFTRAVLPSELPIGVLTALIGGPFFCYVLKRGYARRSPG